MGWSWNEGNGMRGNGIWNARKDKLHVRVRPKKKKSTAPQQTLLSNLTTCYYPYPSSSWDGVNVTGSIPHSSSLNHVSFDWQRMHKVLTIRKGWVCQTSLKMWKVSWWCPKYISIMTYLSNLQAPRWPLWSLSAMGPQRKNVSLVEVTKMIS